MEVEEWSVADGWWWPDKRWEDEEEEEEGGERERERKGKEEKICVCVRGERGGASTVSSSGASVCLMHF